MSRACRPIHIPSPDRRFLVEVSYQKQPISSGDYSLTAGLQLRDRDGSVRDLDLPYSFQTNDLLWSPDSKAFFVNGGNRSATDGFWVYVYRVDDPELKPLNVTEQAQRDMVTSFPPCRASELNDKFCHEWEKEPENNMSGIDWANGSSILIVMSEVPEGGGMGGIKGQMMGYGLEVPTGKILRRMTAREFKREWQASMAFRFHIPDPPEYCQKGNPKNIPGCIGHIW